MDAFTDACPDCGHVLLVHPFFGKRIREWGFAAKCVCRVSGRSPWQ
jgi:hypothetical protein